MTGPLAQQFAQVRDSFEKLRSAGRTSDILKVWCDDGTDALSAIERHVQDMEIMLRAAYIYYPKGTPMSESMGDLLAALPAREKEEECSCVLTGHQNCDVHRDMIP